MEYVASVTSEMFPSAYLYDDLNSSYIEECVEAKLYLSSEFNLEYYITFFENYSKENKYYFVKQYLIDYLNEPEIVERYKKNDLKYTELSEQYRQQMISDIDSNYKSHIPVNLENGLCEESPGSYFISSKDEVIKDLIRSIAIPEITFLQIDKYRHEGRAIYYCFLRAIETYSIY